MLSPDIKVASSKEVNEKELPSSIKNTNNPFKRVSRVKSTSTETRKVKNFSVVAKKNYTNNNRIVKNQNIGISKKKKTNISTETGKKDQKPTKITADLSQVGEQSKTAKDINRNYQKIFETSKVMTQSPSTTKSVTASAAVSQASYSLDFLHSVGVHMTAGSNRTFNPIPSPSPLYANTNRTKCSFSRNTPAFLSEQQCNNNYTKLIYKDHINSTAGLISNRNITPLHCCGVLYQAPYCFPESNYLNHSHNQQCIQNSMGAECQQFPNNRNIHLKKGWNWNNAFKRCSTYANKFGSTSNNELSSSDAIPRARPHQYFRNLRYVLTDNNRYSSNSKSPTPSPKSESSFLSKSHINQKSVLHLNIEQNLMDTSAMANPLSNGYESDSSHSSCRQSEYECCVKNDFEPSSHEIGEAMSLLNFPAYSEEDIRNSQPHCYGSYQNLAYLGTTLNSNYNSPTVYNTVSHETNNHYYADGPMKRSQCHNKSYRGRRQSYINCRSQHFYENLYTPPDKFLAKAHLVQVKGTPETLLNGSKWDQLSQDIWNNFLLAQQTEETFKKKMYLWRYLYVTIKKAYPRFGLYMVGSTISGFGADTSDTDMCLVCRTSSNIDPRMEALLNLTQIKEYLSQSGVFEQFNLIEAKVPILRFKDSMHLLEVDLNFNNSVGIRNTHLLYCYSQYWRLRPLVLITKLWAQYHNINNAKNMTISSYSLSLMVIHFLQCGIHPPVLPCLHNLHPDKFQIILQSNDFGFVDMTEDIGPYRSENTQTIGELFLKFLEYFSNFDYAEKAISVRTGTVLPIEECRQAKSIKNDVHQWKELCIEEPFDLTNTARSVYDCDIFGRIRSIFISSFKHLQESLNINSIFTPVDGVVDPDVVQKTVAAP